MSVQGTDLVSIVGSTVTGSTVGGNLGADTIKLEGVVKGAAIYGGGGFGDTTHLWTVLTASALVQSSVQVH